MFGAFFDTSAVDAFSAEVVREVRKAMPPDAAGKDGGGARRRQQLDDKLGRMVAALVARTRLNVYQKAKLGSRLQDALEAAGYSAEFSREFSYELVKRVAMTTA